jgi:hypothetical protein
MTAYMCMSNDVSRTKETHTQGAREAERHIQDPPEARRIRLVEPQALRDRQEAEILGPRRNRSGRRRGIIQGSSERQGSKRGGGHGEPRAEGDEQPVERVGSRVWIGSMVIDISISRVRGQQWSIRQERDWVTREPWSAVISVGGCVGSVS